MERRKSHGGLSAVFALAVVMLGVLGCGDNVADASREPPPGSGGRTSETGGSGGNGGNVPVSCDVSLADRVTVTTITAPTEILANTEFFPVVLAPRDSGGALVAWRESPTETIRVVDLDASDQLVGTVLTLSGPEVEVHALLAHDDGGAVAIVEEDPDISDNGYCRPAEHPDWWCGKVDLVRFDGSGNTEWRSTLTSKTNVDSDGALFIYWYEHTVRLGWSGREYGVYFRSAGSIASGAPGEVQIPSGDVFRFVSEDGSSVEGGWSWGCSYSWSVRLAHHDHWGAACHGDDTPNALRLLIMDPGRTLGTAMLHEGMAADRRALGGLVATSGGFWLSHIAEGDAGDLELHLADIDNTGTIGEDRVIREAESIDGNYPFRPYMAEYAGDQLLIGWKSGGELQLATLDASTGEMLDGPVTVEAGIDQFQEFASHPNGDVGWAWSPGGTDEVSVVRVRACE